MYLFPGDGIRVTYEQGEGPVERHSPWLLPFLPVLQAESQIPFSKMSA